MANAASQQALEEGKKRLREFLEENPRAAHAAHAVAVSTGNEEYELRNLKSSPRPKIKTDGAEEDDEDDI